MTSFIYSNNSYFNANPRPGQLMFQHQLCSAREVKAVICCSLAHSPFGWSLVVQVDGGLWQKMAWQNRLLRGFLCIPAQPTLYKHSLNSQWQKSPWHNIMILSYLTNHVLGTAPKDLIKRFSQIWQILGKTSSVQQAQRRMSCIFLLRWGLYYC